MRELRNSFRFSLAGPKGVPITSAVSVAPTKVRLRLNRYRSLVVTLNVTAAERDSANETYDFYLIGGDGISEWDLAHFPQIATTGAKRFTFRIQSDLLPQSITTAAPGVSATESASLSTAAAATNAPKTLAAGSVRHGAFGDYIRYELVVAGTIVTGITYSLAIEATE